MRESITMRGVLLRPPNQRLLPPGPERLRSRSSALGHGVLELFAIWVAGAAGFLLGLGVIAPGELSRRDALVLAGRRAIRMIGFVVVLLAVAGTIEGFVSASAWPLTGLLLVSSASVLFLGVYLLNGLIRSR